eukprot:SAG11_NODE_2888_length_2865_cov_1.928778_4_plen_96_part_00
MARGSEEEIEAKVLKRSRLFEFKSCSRSRRFQLVSFGHNILRRDIHRSSRDPGGHIGICRRNYIIIVNAWIRADAERFLRNPILIPSLTTSQISV